MALLTWEQARQLVLVDPATGQQIEHVCAADPERAWYKRYTTTPCVEGYETIVQRADGSLETRDWTPIKLTNFCGESEYMTVEVTTEYDLVNKDTGEVVAEARLGAPASAEVPEEESGSDMEPTFGTDFDAIDALVGEAERADP